ncbi:Beige/BEACH domain containing protein [Trichomonas vaginalis G3]|uniref:Beige/BEACH domain containing protein n=1 Tax=Trichomonas vaginalis (strain ATCC PRA-98 / G3) TaxID=412133 RepID=A2EVD2_TRIV3|nr:platelet formation protein family [Trichomonas vaginalis G3]EAY03378.1 Beige/BEACH domain containing protein [Trichomonas vaginalis G3]KAI5538091.1 platelet formation protein family [Trichomonas vaginalis G3]|eukprot:XP_001315601.1 Beige/BEACH domain containing protein [Trichomonas vaginalis G3]
MQTKNRFQSHSIFCQKSWSSLWHRMKSNNGPWNIEGQTPHYKKSPIPGRLSYHWNYNDHLDAIIKREIYSNSSSEVIENLRNKLIKQISSKSLIFDTDYDNSFNYDFDESKLIYKTKNCQKVYLKKKVNCSFCIYKNGIKYIVNDVITMISSDLIKRISPMKYNHKENSIEILTWNGKLLFFVFPEENNSQILSSFKYMTLNHGSIEVYDEFRFIKEFTEKWQKYQISTFDYLLEINHFASRTFADITQYPIFPWILSNYSSETKELDLSSDKNYRDLSKPPSSISPEKSVKIFKDFEFSQGISTPGEISAFMIRTEPFTTIKINLNGGFFDRKIFSSLEEEWNNFFVDPNDTRELIPEFFSFPEMFLNINHLYLNHMSEDVQLPGYCHSPDEFVYLNRKALESNFVSQKIHQWIDFTFGVLQRKLKSCEYRKELYDDIFDSNPNEDFVDICCLNLGQMPKQVFTTNHLERNIIESNQFKTKRFQHGIDKIVSSSFHNNELLILTTEDIITIKLKNPHDINKNNISFKTKNHKKQIEDCQICYFIDDFVVSNEINQSIEYVSSNKSLPIRGGVSSLSSSDYLLCVGTFAATSHVYLGHDFFDLCDCETFLGEVVCSFVSSKYFVVASCTSSCSLVIHELDGEYIHSVQLDSLPKSVLITENLGFIVVYSESVSRGQTKHFLNVFNINGRSIISKEIPNEIKGILSIKDKHNLDYLLYIDCENKVYVVETFYLAEPRNLLTIEGKFISLHYMKDDNVVLILTEKHVYVLDHLF